MIGSDGIFCFHQEPRTTIVIEATVAEAHEWATATEHGDATKIRGQWGRVEKWEVCYGRALLLILLATDDEAEAA